MILLHSNLRRGRVRVFESESIEWSYRGPGYLVVVSFGSSPTPSPLSRQQLVSLSQSYCVSPLEFNSARSRIIRPRESLALYESFHTLRDKWKISLMSGLIPRIPELKKVWRFSRKCTNFPNFPAALHKTMNVHICTVLRKYLIA